LHCKVAGGGACAGACEDAVAVEESVEQFVASGMQGDEFVVAFGGEPSPVERADAAIGEVVKLEGAPGSGGAARGARDRPAAFGAGEPVLAAAEPGG
jgi:hypothetical protein